MNGKARIRSFPGLPISVTPSAVCASAALWGMVYAVATRLLGVPAKQAAPASLAAVMIHWASVLAHHAGHATAAWSTGHPMIGVRLWGLLGSSLYPADEPSLPSAIHARRALGGPVASLGLGGALALLLPTTQLATFAILDNLVFLGLGSFLPLGFTDGSTLLRLWRERAR